MRVTLIAYGKVEDGKILCPQEGIIVEGEQRLLAIKDHAFRSPIVVLDYKGEDGVDYQSIKGIEISDEVVRLLRETGEAQRTIQKNQSKLIREFSSKDLYANQGVRL